MKKKISHREKLRIARSHMTPVEIQRHISPFLSGWWLQEKARLMRKDFVAKRNSKTLALWKKQQKEQA